MRTTARRTALSLGTIVVTAGLLLTGCTSPGSSTTDKTTVSQADIDKALDTPTKLTFWTWVPDIENEVALFEKKYPKIDVEVVNVGNGADEYTKLRTALKAGKGAPDVAQIEYQYLSSFRLTDSLADLTPYGAADLSDEYVEWVWNQVQTEDGSVWAIPQDSGPLGNLYRSDILAQAGITEAPTTWAQYAEDAATIKAATGSYISNMPGNDPGQMVGLFWQAGAKPFGYDGDKTVKVDIASDETKKVVDYWNDLIQKDLVSVDPDFNDSFYQSLASGKYAGWVTAAWAPVFLQGTAANTSGKWTAAKIPQWNEGDDVSGNWGGSSDVVLKTSENPIAAYELAKFINNDPESTLKFATDQFLFPTKTDTLADPAFVDQQSEFYGGQKVNELFAGVSDTVDVSFEWLPFMDYVYSSYNETLGKAIADKTDLSTALQAWDDEVTAYAKKQGFTVE
ncbi:ABC transporter substrate-binding protein [Agreia sp. Leaf244]|uniref:ABC transporter substrate-binding protein n=1 Tax=Agreia sp. Leaf244 TaxID=1736305 RepID=UPI000AF20713|nr:extracellular solute-binding protein [Agreia sp. Leaf244]